MPIWHTDALGWREMPSHATNLSPEEIKGKRCGTRSEPMNFASYMATGFSPFNAQGALGGSFPGLLLKNKFLALMATERKGM